ncbi:hypothetical protein JD844_015241 [Phrynosoma platyrhinos]|uniref:Uncharacterized protein n=1 Tax=Phrynosoma platyrhinos TaxID=52577 RepID=A0ABQ7T7E5_PHRPL|nr:hypothetical protein JD844_015241 [Phrynosoma platyrhinos]
MPITKAKPQPAPSESAPSAQDPKLYSRQQNHNQAEAAPSAEQESYGSEPTAAASSRGNYPQLSRKPSEARMAPSGSEYTGQGTESRDYVAESEAHQSPGGPKRAGAIQVTAARPYSPASAQNPSAPQVDQVVTHFFSALAGSLSMADPAYASRDEHPSSGYSSPMAEKPMRQVAPYTQAAAPPAAPTPSRQPPPEEEEDEANSYDSDEASRCLL